jgi:hypothetical protein
LLLLSVVILGAAGGVVALGFVVAVGFGWCTTGGGVGEGCWEVVGCCASRTTDEWLVAEKNSPLLPRHNAKIKLSRFMASSSYL